MTYTHTTNSYNERRYGKPWLGIPQGKMLTKDFDFVPWDGRPGDSGIFEFEAIPGQIIAHGQKDLRKNRCGIEGYYIAMPDGTLRSTGYPEPDAMAFRGLSFATRCELMQPGCFAEGVI